MEQTGVPFLDSVLRDDLELCLSFRLIVVAVAVALAAVSILVSLTRKQKILVLDFAVHKPHERWVVCFVNVSLEGVVCCPHQSPRMA